MWRGQSVPKALDTLKMCLNQYVLQITDFRHAMDAYKEATNQKVPHFKGMSCIDTGDTKEEVCANMEDP